MKRHTPFASRDAKLTRWFADWTACPIRSTVPSLCVAVTLIAAGTLYAQSSWQSVDIGTATAGATNESLDVVSLTGSGTDIWNTADGFRFYYQPLNGDGEIVVRVASLQDTSGWAKAAVMLRHSLDPGSPHAMVCVSAEHGTAFQWRAVANGVSQSSAPSEDGTAPRWLKIARTTRPMHASEVNAYVSDDGTTWTPVGYTQNLVFSGSLYVGLAVTSHNDGTLCTAQFDHLQLIKPAAVATGLRVTHRGPNGEIDLAWTNNATDADRLEVQEQAAYPGASWGPVGSAGPTATQFTTNLTPGNSASFLIATYHDLVASYSFPIDVTATVSAGLSIAGATTSSLTLSWAEPDVNQSGPQGGPWSLERSSDGIAFAEIAGGLMPNGGYGYTTTYIDSGLPSATRFYYRVRYLATNGDSSAYSNVVTASTDGPAPNAPSGLNATANSSTSVQLTWTDNSSDETNFAIERSTDGTNFTLLTTVAANTTQYTDNSVAASTTYYFRVRAQLNQSASAYSNVASATTPATSPTGSVWQSGDVGTAAHGSSSFSGSSATLIGSGADIWGTQDGFQFAYQSLVGDGSITARVTGMTDTNGWAKAGIMIRESLSGSAPNVFACVTPEWHGIVAQARGVFGDQTTQAAGPAVNAPCWLQLIRSGNTFTAATSTNGSTWTTYATFTVAMNSSAYAGLAVTSHADGTFCTASFDNISIIRASVYVTLPTPVLTGITSTAGAGTVSSDGLNATVTARSYPTETLTFTGTAQPGLTIWFPYDAPDALPDGETTTDASGHWSVTVQASNAIPGYTRAVYFYASDGNNHRSPTANVAMQVVAAAGSPAVSAATVTCAVGTAITPVQVAATNSPTKFDAAQLSSYGLAISSAGVISGTPSQAANGVQVTVYAINAAGFNWNTITLNLAAAPAGTAWASSDVGTVAIAGSDSTSSTGTITAAGSGNDIWDRADAFHFRYQPLSGNGIIVARVVSMTDTDEWAKAGIMIRETLDAGARNVFVAVTPTWNGIVAQARDTTGGLTTNAAGPARNAPYWLRLTRNGSTFIAATSTDGATWTSFTTFTVPMGAGAYFGLAVTSHTNSAVCTATFDHVAINSATTSTIPDAPSALRVAWSGSTALGISWNDNSANETSFQLEQSTDGVNFSSRATLAANVIDYDDLALNPSTTYYYRVRAVNSSGSSAYSNVVGNTISVQPVNTWTNQAINTAAGNGSDTSGTVVVNGSGNDLLQAADAFEFRYETLNSDGDLIARVVSLQNTDPTAKAGISLRTGLDGRSPGLFLGVDPQFTIRLQQRTTFGTNAALVTTAASAAPIWLKVSRRGNTFSTFYSADGQQWTSLMSVNLALPSMIYAGLAVTSARDGTLAAGTFDQVSLLAVTTTGAPAAPSNLTANPWSNSQLELVWADNSANETGFELQRATASAGPFASITTLGASTRRYIDNALMSGATYYYRIRAINSAGASAYSNTANATVPTTNGPTPAPTLAATATSTPSVALSWTQGSGQYLWYLERSSDGVSFHLLGTFAATESSATDATVAPGITYYYRVRSGDGGGYSPYSNTATATIPATTSSSPWSFADIGQVGIAGSNNASGNSITIGGSGADIWGNADGFYFVWKTWSGDGVVEAQVTSMGNTNGWAKAGVMIRESANADARNVFVALTPGWHGIVAQARTATGDITTQTQGPANNAPYWVRLARSGNTFTASTSADGITWTPFATYAVTMSSTVYFGFAVTSHDNTQLNSAVFTDPYVGTP